MHTVKNVSSILKGKFYHVVVTLTMLYGALCWSIKNFLVQKMKVVEMRMLRLMCGQIKRDQIKNEETPDKAGVVMGSFPTLRLLCMSLSEVHTFYEAYGGGVLSHFAPLVTQHPILWLEVEYLSH